MSLLCQVSPQKRGEVSERMGSPFGADETVETLMLKLVLTNVKINRAKDLMMHLQNLVNHISEETSKIEYQLRPHLQCTMPSSSLYPESLLSLPSDSNSGITEPTYFSHISSPVDSFMDRGSSSDFSNIRNNVGFVNEQTWIQQGLAFSAFQNAFGGIVLPEKGKLQRSVKDAGPLLQTLPMLLLPPPQEEPQNFNFATTSTINDPDVADLGNFADLQRDSFSDSLLNFAGFQSDSWIDAQVPAGSKRQRLC